MSGTDLASTLLTTVSTALTTPQASTTLATLSVWDIITNVQDTHTSTPPLATAPTHMTIAGIFTITASKSLFKTIRALTILSVTAAIIGVDGIVEELVHSTIMHTCSTATWGAPTPVKAINASIITSRITHIRTVLDTNDTFTTVLSPTIIVTNMTTVAIAITPTTTTTTVTHPHSPPNQTTTDPINDQRRSNINRIVLRLALTIAHVTYILTTTIVQKGDNTITLGNISIAEEMAILCRVL